MSADEELSMGRWTRKIKLLMVWVALLVGSAAQATPASDFTLHDLDGRSVSLSSFKGKVVVLSFWATWCAPCKVEMPHLQKLLDAKAAEGLVVLSVSTDDARSKPQVKPYIRRNNYTFPVLYDLESKAISAYNPSKTLPFTVVIGRNFEVAHLQSGYNPGDEVALAALVSELLAK